jgi:Lrp/AsnC family leucine-responsive transcriptional regulator
MAGREHARGCSNGAGGDDCFILKVLARSMRHLEEITGRIADLGGVTTSVVYSSPLPRRDIAAKQSG